MRENSRAIISEEARDETINLLWWLTCGLMIPGFGVSILRATFTGWTWVYTLQIELLASSLVLLYFRRSLAVRVKLWTLVGVLAGVAVAGLWRFGYFGAGQLTLILIPILLWFFEGRRIAVIATGGCSATYVFFAARHLSGSLQGPLDPSAYLSHASAWGTKLVAMAVVGAGVIVLFTRLLRLTSESNRREAESEARFQTLVEQVPALIYTATADEQRRTLYLGPQAEQLLGYGLGELESHPALWAERVHPGDRERVWSELREAKAGSGEFASEYRWLHRDGRVRWLRDVARLVRDETGRPRCLQGILFDVSDRKLREEERLEAAARLRKQQRLEAIGTLAGGVAYEINNPANGILNYAEILRAQLPRDSEARQIATEITRETERVAAIVRNLLTYARQETPEKAPLIPAQIIEETLSLIRVLIKRDHITLVTEIDDGLPMILAHGEQLEQMLMNLLTNARDALNARFPNSNPEKVLRVKAGTFEEPDGTWLRITVEDHGTGVSPEVQRRMFEPFFTTKGRFKGSGLGLCTSLGIAEDHRGRLRVETAVGRFTRVHFEMPGLREGRRRAVTGSPSVRNSPVGERG